MFGISNCDTIKKAKKYLSDNQVEFQFHDYRKDGLSAEQLAEFESALGWEQLLNKRGTTFRQLDEASKNALYKELALKLLLEHPAMIKRPLLVHNGQYHLGFKAADYDKIFNL